MNPQPKQKRLELPEYLEWLKDKPCCVCGREPYGDYKSIPAHQRVGGAGGTGVKPPDTYALPLCHWCHDKQHHGVKLFFDGQEYIYIIKYLTEFLRWKNDKN